MNDLAGDPALDAAAQQVRSALAGAAPRPEVTAFFHEETFTASYVVADPATKRAAIIDSVLDFDQASGRTATAAADEIIAFVRDTGLSVEWLLETHVHADHLSAAPHLQEKLGGALAIGAGVVAVQQVFGDLFNEGDGFRRDGSQFDRLLGDGDSFAVGGIAAVALHVPGHTPADMAYVIGDCLFVGDTLFMPDSGTARCDFPGGDARQLYRAIRRLLRLPGETRMFLCHDYMAPERDFFAWETTVAAQKSDNIHICDRVDEDDFVELRTARDSTLGTPRLLFPSIQINMRAGHLPDPEDNGTRYLKLPLNAL